MNPALEAQKLVTLAATLGLETDVRTSNLSNSHYLTIWNPQDNTAIQVRISNHEQVPLYYQKFDLEIGDHHRANCPETHSPKLLKKLTKLSQQPHQTDTILSEWARSAEHTAQTTLTKAARRNTAEAQLASQTADTIRNGGSFSNKTVRVLIQHTTRSNHLWPTRATISRIQKQVAEKLRQDQGHAILTPAVLMTKQERDTARAEHQTQQQRN